MMKVLHVMKTLPYPPMDGFRADILARMRSMCRLGIQVHALITVGRQGIEETHLAELRKIIHKVDLVERSRLLGSLFSLRPVLVSRNRSLSEYHLEDEYDITLAESEHVISIFDNPSLRTRLRAIRIHNDERKYMLDLARADKHPGWKVFFASEALRYSVFEKKAYDAVDTAWFISKSECADFQVRFGSKHPIAKWLPPSLDPQKTETGRVRQSRKVLFVGGLSNSPNREGVSWYLRNVHPLLLEMPGYEFIVAGNTGMLRVAQLFAQQVRTEARTTVLLDLPDLTSVYEECALIINPMRHGSGVKMKTIHAVQQRIPLVTTSVGAEGSGFVDKSHVRIADGPREMADSIRSIINDPVSASEMAERAYSYLTLRYDADKNITMLLDELLPAANLIPAGAVPQPCNAE